MTIQKIPLNAVRSALDMRRIAGMYGEPGRFNNAAAFNAGRVSLVRVS